MSEKLNPQISQKQIPQVDWSGIYPPRPSKEPKIFKAFGALMIAAALYGGADYAFNGPVTTTISGMAQSVDKIIPRASIDPRMDNTFIEGLYLIKLHPDFDQNGRPNSIRIRTAPSIHDFSNIIDPRRYKENGIDVSKTVVGELITGEAFDDDRFQIKDNNKEYGLWVRFKETTEKGEEKTFYVAQNSKNEFVRVETER